ncbi:MAG: hypothetical protein L3I99_04260 [Sulfurimonas sp.]|nr:hypothetical protein [Sulfurimonas sp.]
MNLVDYKAGSFKQEYKYKSFLPTKINHTFIWDDAKINMLLEKATMLLGQLNAYTDLIPNVDIYIKMHITTEANKSSKIEGTKTEIDEIVMSKESLNPEKRDDWQEVHNYVEAINYSIDALQKLPLSNRLIKQTHKILLTSARGESKRPGEFRVSQNWIGGTNLLITLYLVSNNLLDKPSLYLSDFFERNKGLYYENLTLVRQTNDLVTWVNFFLEGTIETSKTMKELGVSKPTAIALLKDFQRNGILKEVTGFQRNKLYLFEKYIQLFA